jgi:hypothetical protein
MRETLKNMGKCVLIIAKGAITGKDDDAFRAYKIRNFFTLIHFKLASPRYFINFISIRWRPQ